MALPDVQRYKNLKWPSLAMVANVSPPFLLLHGGLGDQLERKGLILKTLKNLGLKVQSALRKSNALQMIEAGVRALESEPMFNAGLGARLQRDGVARLSASMMDGKRQRLAAVSNIISIQHPSEVTRLLLEERDRNLSSYEASRFAFQKGLKPKHVETPKRLTEWHEKQNRKFGTVGCVALDQGRNTADATSTGGRGFETPGRVSDSFTPAGNFASAYGAVSCTGIGEEILEAAAAAAVVTRLEDGMSLEEAVTKTFARHQKSEFGMIALDRLGNCTVHATRGSLAFVLVNRAGVFPGLLPEDWKNYAKTY